MKTFRVDPEFRGLLRAQTKRERDALARKIEGDGCLPGALVVANIKGNWFLIDGHSTLDICKELNIATPEPIVINFPDRGTVIEWIIENQAARRNLSEAALDKLREDRVIRVAEAKVAGESNRTIAEEEGVSEMTVRNDLQEAGAKGFAPEPISGKVIGKDGKEYPAKALTESAFCKRCQRVGPVKDCPACTAAREKAGRTKPSGKRKAGSELYDWREFERHFSKVALMPDAVAKSYKEKSGDFKECLRLLSEFTKVWQAWKKRLQKVKHHVD